MRNELRLQQGLLQPEHLERVRAAARDARELAMVECLFTMRRIEVARLQWADLRLETGMVYIPRGKGGTASWTLLLPSTRASLLAWQAEAPQDAYVFPVPGSGSPGRPYTPGGLGRLIQALLTRAGCWSRGMGNCHRFRHTFATAYLKANSHDVTGLQRLLRHTDIRVTSRYVLYAPEDLAPRLGVVQL